MCEWLVFIVLVWETSMYWKNEASTSDCGLIRRTGCDLFVISYSISIANYNIQLHSTYPNAKSGGSDGCAGPCSSGGGRSWISFQQPWIEVMGNTKLQERWKGPCSLDHADEGTFEVMVLKPWKAQIRRWRSLEGNVAGQDAVTVSELVSPNSLNSEHLPNFTKFTSGLRELFVLNTFTPSSKGGDCTLAPFWSFLITVKTVSSWFCLCINHFPKDFQSNLGNVLNA